MLWKRATSANLPARATSQYNNVTTHFHVARGGGGGDSSSPFRERQRGNNKREEEKKGRRGSGFTRNRSGSRARSFDRFVVQFCDNLLEVNWQKLARR